MVDIGDEAGEQAWQMMNPLNQSSVERVTLRWSGKALKKIWDETAGKLLDRRRGAKAALENDSQMQQMLAKVLAGQNDQMEKIVDAINKGMGNEHDFEDGIAQVQQFDFTDLEQDAKAAVLEALKASMKEEGLPEENIEALRDGNGDLSGIFIVAFEDKDAEKFKRMLDAWKDKIREATGVPDEVAQKVVAKKNEAHDRQSPGTPMPTHKLDFSELSEDQVDKLSDIIKESAQKAGMPLKNVHEYRWPSGKLAGVIDISYGDGERARYGAMLETMKENLLKAGGFGESVLEKVDGYMAAVSAEEKPFPTETARDLAMMMQEEDLAAGIDSHYRILEDGGIEIDIPLPELEDWRKANAALSERLDRAQQVRSANAAKAERAEARAKEGKMESWESKRERAKAAPSRKGRETSKGRAPRPRTGIPSNPIQGKQG